MSLPVLIGVAIVLPILIIAAVYGFARGTSWLALRPRAMAVLMLVLGVAWLAVGLWEMREGVGIGNTAFIVGGVLFFISGLYDWFRGEPVKLD